MPTPSFSEARLFPSIPEGSWQVDASDPHALTQLLDLPGLVVTRLEYNDVQETLHLLCQLTSQTARCPNCEQASSSVHAYTRRAVRDLPWAAKPCLLEFLARRFYCPTCREPFREDLEWLPRCRRLTARYQQAVFDACAQISLRAVSQREGLGYKTVERLYYRLAQEQTPFVPDRPVRHLGSDEFALKKGYGQFAVALSDLEAGKVIAVLPDRKKETLLAYFALWTHQQRAAVQQIALDFWDTYAQVGQACFPQARRIADRFHVLHNLNDALSTARRVLQRGLPQAHRPALKGCRWLLVRNAEDLTQDEQIKLAQMFVLAPDLAGLYRLKEGFRTLFQTTTDPKEAAKRLEDWIQQVHASGLSQFNGFVALLGEHWEPIVNFFHTRLTSAGVEGLNNKIKVVKRCAYGFGNFEHFALRILVECDGTT